MNTKVTHIPPCAKHHDPKLTVQFQEDLKLFLEGDAKYDDCTKMKNEKMKNTGEKQGKKWKEML
jgi:hypothetical protein